MDNLRGSVPAFAWRESGKTTLSIPDRDSNLDLPVIDSLVYCKSSVLYMITYNVATKHPEQNLDCLLGFQLAKANESLPDLYVVGLQEVKSQPQNIVLDALFDDPWTNAL
ncbi:unnamed protein product, partial [Timema podura]|nr:unnamed protein product [Timema podura]